MDQRTSTRRNVERKQTNRRSTDDATERNAPTDLIGFCPRSLSYDDSDRVTGSPKTLYIIYIYIYIIYISVSIYQLYLKNVYKEL